MSNDIGSIGARRVAALGNPRRMAWAGLGFALAAWVLMGLSRGTGVALLPAFHLDPVRFDWVGGFIDIVLALAALVVVWRGITNSRRAREHPLGVAKRLATGALVFGWLVVVVGVVNLVLVFQAAS